jgi:FAD/FMN-containing dehydrogenase
VPPAYFVHFESGKRVYQLYSELDRGDSTVPDSLAVLMQTKFGNNKFLGSWGFSTLGSAGGQTVVGALSTGTHGGDFERPPIADSVVAVHVVLDGGKHVWIERGTAASRS